MVETTSSNPGQWKFKYLKLNDGRTIKIQTYYNLNFFISYENIQEINKPQKERFRDLISNAEIVDGFTEDDYALLSDKDLEIIAEGLSRRKELSLSPIDNVLDEIDEEISIIAKTVSKALEPLQEKISQVVNPLQEKITEVMKPLQPLSKKLEETYAPLAKQMQSITKQWSEAITKFLKEQKEYLDAKEMAALIATKYDWFIAFDFYVGKEFFEKLVELDEMNPNNEEIDDLFINYYDLETRKQMIRDLKEIELIKEYEEILSQIEYGYERELYYLVIPTLFTMIEGMVAKGFQHKGYLGGPQIKEYVNDLLDGYEAQSLQEIINNRMLASFKHGEMVDSPISRHAILHGGDIDYGMEATALRVFLIFFHLAFAIGLRNIKND